MSRRSISPQDDRRWVFNRLAAEYRHRPGYPPALLARLLALGGGPGARVAELGAGTGLLCLPLARLGARVTAVEPARAMLDVLRARAGAPDVEPMCAAAPGSTPGVEPIHATALGSTPGVEPNHAAALGSTPGVEPMCAAAPGSTPGVDPIHAAAEETGLPSGAFDLVVLADALQWVDPQRCGREAARLLAPGGALAVVAPRLAATPFLAALAERIAQANPKARPAPPPVAHLFSAAGLPAPAEERFHDEVRLDDAGLEGVLRSLSYVGPALGPPSLEALLADARALAAAHGGAVWRREIDLAWSSPWSSPTQSNSPSDDRP